MVSNGNNFKSWRDTAAMIYSQHPDWNSGQIYRELKEQLGESNVPASVNSIQKWRQKVEPNVSGAVASGIDAPWHMGTLEAYPLPSETVSDLLKISRWAAHEGLPALTIREAGWVDKLNVFLHEEIKNWKVHVWFETKSEEVLYLVACYYAAYELAGKISNGVGTIIDTSPLDQVLMQGSKQFVPLISKSPYLKSAVEAYIRLKVEKESKKDGEA